MPKYETFPGFQFPTRTSPPHTLVIGSTPSGIAFTLDGTGYTSPWNGTVTDGTYTVIFPSTFTIGSDLYGFDQWEDSSTSPTRILNVTADTTIHATYVIISAPTLDDNFNDNSRDVNRWEEHTLHSASVAETNQRLEGTVNAQYAKAGYLSQYQYDIDGRVIRVEYSCNNVYSCELGISLTKNLTPVEIWAQDDFYLLRKIRTPSNTVRARGQVNDVEDFDVGFASSGNTGSISISKEGSDIVFYENDVEFYRDTYSIASTQVYVWIFVDAGDTYTGTDWLDNITMYDLTTELDRRRIITGGFASEGTFIVSHGYGGIQQYQSPPPPVVSSGFGGVPGTWIVGQGFGRRAPYEKGFDIDLVIARAGVEKPFNLDTQLQRIANQQAFDIDLSILEFTKTRLLSIDTHLSNDYYENLDIDTILSQRYTSAFNIDVNLVEVFNMKYFNIDTLVSTLYDNLNLDIDTVIRKTNTELFDADVITRLTGSEAFDIDTALQQIAGQVGFNIDVDVREPGEFVPLYRHTFFEPDIVALDVGATTGYPLSLYQLDFDIDAVIKTIGLETAFNIDTKLNLSATYEESFDIDTQAQAVGTEQALDIDTTLYAVGTGLFDIDTYVKKLNIPVLANIDIQLKAIGTSDSFDIDTQVQKTGLPVLIDVDLQIQDTFTEAFDIDVRVLNPYERLLGIDAVLFKRSEEAFDVDLVVYQRGTVQFNVDGVLKDTIEELFDVDAIIRETGYSIMDVDAVLFTINQTAFNIDLKLFFFTYQLPFDIDMRLRKSGLERVFDIDIVPWRFRLRPFAMDMRLIREYKRELYADISVKSGHGELDFTEKQ